MLSIKAFFLSTQWSPAAASTGGCAFQNSAFQNNAFQVCTTSTSAGGEVSYRRLISVHHLIRHISVRA